LSEKVLRLS